MGDGGTLLSGLMDDALACIVIKLLIFLCNNSLCFKLYEYMKMFQFLGLLALLVQNSICLVAAFSANFRPQAGQGILVSIYTTSFSTFYPLALLTIFRST